MFDKLVAGLLTSYLGEYFENIDAQQVKVSVWKGDVKLKNIKVRRDALRAWNVPFCPSHGLIEDLHIRIPWTRLASESVVIHLSKVVLVVEDKIALGYDPAKLREEAQARKQRDLDADEEAMLADWAASLAPRTGGGGSNEPSTANAAVDGPERDDEEAQRSSTFSARLRANVLNNIRVEVDKFELCYNATTSTTTVEAVAPATEPAPCLTVTVDSFKTYACSHRYVPAFTTVRQKLLHKAMDLTGVRVSTSGPGMASHPRSSPTLLVAPFNVFAKLQYQPIPFHSSIPTHLCAVRVEDVHTHLDDRQWRLLRRLSREMWSGAEAMESYTAYRPGLADGGPCKCPRAWWRYAIQSVMAQYRRERARTVGVRFHWDAYQRLKAQRERYALLYMRSRRDLLHLEWARELAAEEAAELAELERVLPMGTLCLARRGALQRAELEREAYQHMAREKKWRVPQDTAEVHSATPPLPTATPPATSGEGGGGGGWFARWWAPAAAVGTVEATHGRGSSTSGTSAVPGSGWVGSLSVEERAEVEQAVRLVSAERWTQVQRLAIAKEFGLSADDVHELSGGGEGGTKTDTTGGAIPSAAAASPVTAAVAAVSGGSSPTARDAAHAGPRGLWAKCFFQFVSSTVEVSDGNAEAAPFLRVHMGGLSAGLVVDRERGMNGWLAVQAYTVSTCSGREVLCRRGGEGGEGDGGGGETRERTAPTPTQSEMNAIFAEVLQIASVPLGDLGHRLSHTATLFITASARGVGGHAPVDCARSPNQRAAPHGTDRAEKMPYELHVCVAPLHVELHTPLVERLVRFCVGPAAGQQEREGPAGVGVAEDCAAIACPARDEHEVPSMEAVFLPEPVRLSQAEERDLRDPSARLLSLRQRVEAAWLVAWDVTLRGLALHVMDTTPAPAREAAGDADHGGTTKEATAAATAIHLGHLLAHNDAGLLLNRRARAAAARQEAATPPAVRFGESDEDWLDHVHVTLSGLSVDCQTPGGGDRKAGEVGPTWHHILHPATLHLVARRSLLGRRTTRYPALAVDVRCVSEVDGVSLEPLTLSWSRSQLFAVSSSLSSFVDLLLRLQQSRFGPPRQPTQSPVSAGSGVQTLDRELPKSFWLSVESLAPAYMVDDDAASESAMDERQQYHHRHSHDAWEAEEMEAASAAARPRRAVDVLPGALVVYHRQRAAYPKVFYELIKGHHHLRLHEAELLVELFVEAGGLPHAEARVGVLAAKRTVMDLLSLPPRALHNMTLLMRYAQDYIAARAGQPEVDASLLARLTASLATLERASHTTRCHHARLRCGSAQELRALVGAIRWAALPFGRYTPDATLLRRAEVEAVPAALREFSLLHCTLTAASAQIALKEEEQHGDGVEGTLVDPPSHTLALSPLHVEYRQLPHGDEYTCTMGRLVLDTGSGAAVDEVGVGSTAPHTGPGALAVLPVEGAVSAGGPLPMVLRMTRTSRTYPLPALVRTSVDAGSCAMEVHVHAGLAAAAEHAWDSSGILTSRVFGHTIARCTPFIASASAALGGAEPSDAPPPPSSCQDALRAAAHRWRVAPSEGGLWKNMAALRTRALRVSLYYPADGHELLAQVDPTVPALTLAGEDVLMRWKQCAAQQVASVSVRRPLLQGLALRASERTQPTSAGLADVLTPLSDPTAAPCSLEMTFQSDTAPPVLSLSDFLGDSTGALWGSTEAEATPGTDTNAACGIRFTRHLDVTIAGVRLTYAHQQFQSMLELATRGVVARLLSIVHREAFFTVPRVAGLTSTVRFLRPWPRLDEPGPPCDWGAMEKRLTAHHVVVHLPFSAEAAGVVKGGGAETPPALEATVERLTLADRLSSEAAGAVLLQTALTLVGCRVGRAGAPVVLRPATLELTLSSAAFRTPRARGHVADRQLHVRLLPGAPVVVLGALDDYEALMGCYAANFTERPWTPAFVTPPPNTEREPFAAALDGAPGEGESVGGRVLNHCTFTAAGSLVLSMETTVRTGSGPPDHAVVRACLVLERTSAALLWRQDGSFTSSYRVGTVSVWDLSHLHGQYVATLRHGPEEVCHRSYAFLGLRPAMSSDDRTSTEGLTSSVDGLTFEYGSRHEAHEGGGRRALRADARIGIAELSVVPRFLFSLRDSFGSLRMRNAVGRVLGWPRRELARTLTGAHAGPTVTTNERPARDGVAHLPDTACAVAVHIASAEVSLPCVRADPTTGAATLHPFFLSSTRGVSLVVQNNGSAGGDPVVTAAVHAIDRVGVFRATATGEVFLRPLLVPAPPPPRPTGSPRTCRPNPADTTAAEERRCVDEPLHDEVPIAAPPPPPLAHTAPVRADADEMENWLTLHIAGGEGARVHVQATWLVLPHRTDAHELLRLWTEGGLLQLPLLTQFREERGFLTAAVVGTAEASGTRTTVAESWISRALARHGARVVCARPTIAVADHGLDPRTLADLSRGLFFGFGEDVQLRYTHDTVVNAHCATLLLPGMYLCPISRPGDRFLESFTVTVELAANVGSAEKRLEVHMDRLDLRVEQRYYEMLLRTLVKQLVEGSSVLMQGSGTGAASVAADSSQAAQAAADLTAYLFGMSNAGGAAEEDKRAGAGPGRASLVHDYILTTCLASPERKARQVLLVVAHMEGLQLRVDNGDLTVCFSHERASALVRTTLTGEEVEDSRMESSRIGARTDAPEPATALPSLAPRRKGFAGPSTLRVVSSRAGERARVVLVDKTVEVCVNLPVISVGVRGTPPILSLTAEVGEGGGADDFPGSGALREELAAFAARHEWRGRARGRSRPGSSSSNNCYIDPPALAGTLTATRVNREENVSCALGVMAANLDAAAVAAAVRTLYKPYAQIVLPEFRVKEVKVFDRDITLTEDLVLSSRIRLRVANTIYNHVTINGAGHSVYFVPDGDAAVLLLDEGLTLRIMNANLFLHGHPLEFYTQAGSGSYVVLDSRTSVVRSGSTRPPGRTGARHTDAQPLTSGTTAAASELLDELFLPGEPTTAPAAGTRARMVDETTPRLTVVHEEVGGGLRRVMGSCRLHIRIPDVVNDGDPHEMPSTQQQQQHQERPGPEPAVALVLSAAVRACLTDHRPTLARPPAQDNSQHRDTRENQRHTRGGDGAADESLDRRATVDLTEVRLESVRTADGLAAQQQQRIDLLTRWGLQAIYLEETGPPHARCSVELVALTGAAAHLRYSDLLLCARSLRHALRSVRLAMGSVDVGALTALFAGEDTESASLKTGGGTARLSRQTASVTGAQPMAATPPATSTTAYALSIPSISIWIVNDSVRSANEPLFHVRVEKIATPVWVRVGPTTNLQATFDLGVDYYDPAASAWCTFLERVSVDVRRTRRANASVEDVQQRKGASKLAVRVGELRTYVSPTLLRAVRRLLQLREDFLQTQRVEAMRGLVHGGVARSAVEEGEGAAAGATPSARAHVTPAPYHALRIIQSVGRVCFGLVTPHDRTDSADTRSGREGGQALWRGAAHAQGALRLGYLDEHAFTFPRVNGKEMAPSQQCVAITYEGAEGSGAVAATAAAVMGGDRERGTSPSTTTTTTATLTAVVRVSGQGRCTLGVGPPLCREHVLVDVRVENSQRLVTLRTNVRLVNELPMAVELLTPGASSGVDERLGLVEARSSRSLPLEWMRSRLRLRPVASELRHASSRTTCESAALGVSFDTLYALAGESFLCVCPITTTQGGGGGSGGRPTVVARGPDFEIHRGVQRAVYTLLRVSATRDVARSARRVSVDEHDGPRAGAQAAAAADTVASITAPLFLVNGMGVPVTVALLVPAGAEGRRATYPGAAPPGLTVHVEVAHITLHPGERYGVTEADPLQELRIDVALTQSNGGTLGRAGYPPALVYAPQGRGRCYRHYTIADTTAGRATFVVNLAYSGNEVTLWCPYWIVNETPHALQFSEALESGPLLIAGLGQHRDDGVLPSGTTPFLYSSEYAAREGDKARLRLRVGHDVADSRLSTGSTNAGLLWSGWSGPLNITAITDSATVLCALQRGILSTLTYTVGLGGGDAASTRVLTLRPRWVLLNRTSHALTFRQTHTDVSTGGRGAGGAGEPALSDTIAPAGCHVMDLVAADRGAGADGGRASTAAVVRLQVRYADSESAWSSSFPISAMGDHALNVTYEGLVPMAQYWPQGHASIAPGALPPLRPEAIVDCRGELFVRRVESDVLRVSCYLSGSMTYVEVTHAEQPPYLIENRTEYTVFIKQLDARGYASAAPTVVYPKTTKAYTWTAPEAAPVMQLWVTNGQEQHPPGSAGAGLGLGGSSRTSATQAIRVHFDPREVVRNPSQLQQEVDLVDGSGGVLFVRVRGVHGASYAVSITAEPTIDAHRALPYPQWLYQVDVESSHTLLLAASHGSQVTPAQAVALLTVKPLFLRLAQGAAADAASQQVRDVQRFDIQLRTVQLDDERHTARERVVFQLVDTTAASYVRWERTLLRTTPLVYCPIVAVSVAPVELHVEDSFISAAEAYKEAMREAWRDTSTISGGRSGAVGSMPRGVAANNTTAAETHDGAREALLRRAFGSRDSARSSNSEADGGAHGMRGALRLSAAARPAGGGESLAACAWVGEALALASSATSPPGAAGTAVGKKAPEWWEGWSLRTVLVDRLLLDKLYLGVSLYRSPGSANDPLRRHLGVLSVLVRSVKDARLDWPRIDQRGVSGTMWTLLARYHARYTARMHEQAPNLLSIPGLHTVRGFFEDLLGDYLPADDVRGGGAGGGGGGGGGGSASQTLRKPRVSQRREARLALDQNRISPSPSLGAAGAMVTVTRAGAHTGVRERSAASSRSTHTHPPRTVRVGDAHMTISDVARRCTWSVFASVADAQDTRRYGHVAVECALRQLPHVPVHDPARDSASAAELVAAAARRPTAQHQSPVAHCTRCAEVEAMLALQRLGGSGGDDDEDDEDALPAQDLFHPREGSLTWAEYLHHISWTEFLRGCTDEEVLRYRTAMLNSLLGQAQNTIRLARK